MFWKKRPNLSIFILLVVVVAVVNIVILQPVLKYQLIDPLDDWIWLAYYKSLSPLNLLPKLWYMWVKLGIRESGFAIYAGFFGDILGNNYPAYNYLSVFFKILSTITLFPLILVVFKNRLLAFLTTLLYGITSASTGSLYWFMKGNTFIGTALMNLFLTTYYLALERKKIKWFLMSIVLVFLAYITAAVRVYPIFIIIVFLEIYYLFKNRKIKNLLVSFLRLSTFILPPFFISRQATAKFAGFDTRPFVILNYIKNGNLHDLLSPIAGIGSSLFTRHYWRLFGNIYPETFANFGNYLTYLIKGPIIVFAVLTFILSRIISTDPKKFFIRAFSLNLIFEIIMYFVATYHFNIPKNLWFDYDSGLFYTIKYATLAGIFVLTIAFLSFLEWRKDRKNRLLFALWIGPLFSLIFLSVMWVFLGYLLHGYSTTGYYYAIPSIGITLFIASILTLAYKKLKGHVGERGSPVGIIFVVLVVVFQTSSLEIARDFTADNPMKVSMKEQQVIHDKLLDKLGDAGQNGDLLVYFELPKDQTSFDYYRRALWIDSTGFADMINWRRDNKGFGCVEAIGSIDILASIYRPRDSKPGFIYKGRCVLKTGTSFKSYAGKENVLYSIDSFYAFKIENGDFLDIKVKVLNELNSLEY